MGKYGRGRGNRRGRGRGQRPQINNESNRDLQDRVLHLLNTRNTPEKALSIAKSLGFRASSDINPILYRMSREGLLKMSDGKPPLWEVQEHLKKHSEQLNDYSGQYQNVETDERNEQDYLAFGQSVSMAQQDLPTQGPSTGAQSSYTKSQVVTQPADEMLETPVSTISEYGKNGVSTMVETNPIPNIETQAVSDSSNSPHTYTDEQRDKEKEDITVMEVTSGENISSSAQDDCPSNITGDDGEHMDVQLEQPSETGSDEIEMTTAQTASLHVDESEDDTLVPDPSTTVNLGDVQESESSSISEKGQEIVVTTEENICSASEQQITQILQRLKRLPDNMTSTLDLYGTLGYSSEEEIVPVLLSMQSEGFIDEFQNRFMDKPKWVLKKKGRDKLLFADKEKQMSSDQSGNRARPLPPDMILKLRKGIPIESLTGTSEPQRHSSQRVFNPKPTYTQRFQEEPFKLASTQLQLSTIEICQPVPPPITPLPRVPKPPVSQTIAPETREKFTRLITPQTRLVAKQASTDPPSEEEQKIMQRLSRLPDNTASTIDLSAYVGYQTKKDINPVLYHMEEKGWIRKVNESPPKWKIVNAGKAVLRSGNIEGQSLATSKPPPTPTTLIHSRGGAHPPPEPLTTVRPPPHRPPQATASPLPGTMGQGARIPLNPLEILKARSGVANMRQPASLPMMSLDRREQPPTGAPLPTGPASLPTPIVPASRQSTAVSAASAIAALTGENFAALNKNPVSALMEYAQSRKSTATIEVLGQSGPPHKPRFKMAAVMGGRVFPEVESCNKKEGKAEAADMALRILMGEGQMQIQGKQQLQHPMTSIVSGNATHFDQIAGLSHLKFNTLAASISEMMSGKKVLAALVMKTSAEDDGLVISLGTGNRCITGEHLSLEGRTVNDSHAEIITRRAFIRFLYNQLLHTNPGTEDSILEASPTGLWRFKVKDSVTFHLYISTAPCGDGALFSPRDSDITASEPVALDQAHNPIFTSKVQGILRTKMEGGEGTIPIESGFKGQTWDGILRGERLRTMSCSDKVCRWNFLGMQGALLSHFIDPIYMASLTLGNLYDHGHLSRAVCCRLSHGNEEVESSLPQGYRVNHPHLGRVTVYEPPREIQKSKEYSVNWSLGDPQPEVTDGTKGACLAQVNGDYVSHLSKSHFYASFMEVSKKLERNDLLKFSSYKEAKDAAVEFQQAKNLMFQHFIKQGYGKWVGKPIEEKMF